MNQQSMTEIIFPKYEQVYKGNLHSHTTRSDGKYTEQEVIDGYYQRGYDFLCVSDHQTYWAKANPYNNLLLLHGMEGEVYDTATHIHAIRDYSVKRSQDIEHDYEWPFNPALDWQATVDEYVTAGNIAIINHPRWSYLDYYQLATIQNYVGLEIYNQNCMIESLSGQAEDYWDFLLQRGIRVFGFASDDAHAEDMGQPVSEFFGGYIMVSAPARTHQDIVNSMKSGDFYASSGAAIQRIEKQGDRIYVWAKQSASITFISYPNNGRQYLKKDGSLIDWAQYQVPTNVQYVRIVVTDPNGRKAWSNPIFFEH